MNTIYLERDNWYNRQHKGHGTGGSDSNVDGPTGGKLAITSGFASFQFSADK